MKRFVGYIVDKAIKALPRKKKVSPTIKSVKPTKDIKGSVKRTKSDAYVKNIDDLNKARKKITEGKKMMKEGQKIRKQMTGTGRAFQFKNLKTYHAVEPGSKKIDPAIIKKEKTKRFSTAKELEQQEYFNKGKGREKKMGGGMMGRRMGYSVGLSVRPAVKKIKKLMDEAKAKKQDKARVKKMGGGMMGRRFGMKKGSKFPDLTGDGKVTFADILKGRGVINGKKKGKK